MSNNATGNVFASIREVAIELEGLEKNGETESSSARLCAKKFSSLSESVHCRASCSGCQSCFMGRLLAYSSPAPSQNWPRSATANLAEKEQSGRPGFAYFAEISTFAT